jgi:1-deoxyxylulose-5-phosphate synthase
LLKREEEREMLPMCADTGVGCVPYSALGKSRLARPLGQHTQRGDTDHVAESLDLDVDQPVVEAVHQVAGVRGVPMAHIAMAWVLSKPVVTAPMSVLSSLSTWPMPPRRFSCRSPEDEVRRLEEPHTTQPAYWW